METKRNWFEKPTKKEVILISSIGVFGVTGFLLTMTNFFTESPFQGKYWIFWFLIFSSTLTTFSICRNYFKRNA